MTEATPYPFKVGDQYSRNDVFQLVGVPAHKGGPWFTGYASHGSDWFIFCGVGTKGRTGHDYNNHFIGDDLEWSAKGPSTLRHSSIQGLLYSARRVYLFYRENDRDPFTFAGLATPLKAFDSSPVKVLWKFREVDGSRLASSLAEEIDEDDVTTIIEGARKSVQVNVYERDPNARRKCLARWGTRCTVCAFDFEASFGALGAGFIHVHHLRPLGEIGEAYVLNPVDDLRPVCPNCHAMLHRRRPALTLEQLRAQLTGS